LNGILVRMREIDHLVYATPDVDETVEALNELLGVRAVTGGSHPGRGTRNALIGLGPRCYLEIVGPDLAQPAPPGPRWFLIDSLKAPRLVAWAVRDAGLEERCKEAAAANLTVGPIVAGSRRRPDGRLLSWRFTDPIMRPADGVVPFFIDWGTGPHPADLLPQEVRLIELRVQHCAAAPLAFVRTLGTSATVLGAESPRLSATLETPRGTVNL
jgi:Glyoxalase-like domain